MLEALLRGLPCSDAQRLLQGSHRSPPAANILTSTLDVYINIDVSCIMERTQFDRYLDQQMSDPGFAARFREAGEAWDVAVKLAALREQAGLTQSELARKVGTSQQQISRLESPSYEGHSLSMLRRVADALGTQIHVSIDPLPARKRMVVAEARASYGAKKKK